MTNRTIFVTGAGRDIGRSIAERLGKSKNFVIFHYASSRIGAEQALERVMQSGGNGAVIQADLRDSEGPETLANKVVEVLAGRPLDVFVSNAAIAAASPLGQTELTDIQAMTMVNLLAPFELINRFAPHMSDGGAIITLSVAATQRIFSPDFAYFSATKAAVDCLVRHWAVALGSRGIRVNAIAPGVIEANFRAQLLQDAAFRHELESATALKRVGQIDDVVDVVEFLTSAESRWITGQVIDVSGGWKI
ncbi:MAG: SDR family oxidoreductase [Anaerolineae bacterium]|nr:SDR family oxidoreductase [Gloeobacterales cyanobacterium ES-bin-313]